MPDQQQLSHYFDLWLDAHESGESCEPEELVAPNASHLLEKLHTMIRDFLKADQLLSQPNRKPLPSTLEGYEELIELGRGGMGVVYRAFHRTLGRAVALKMILNQWALGEDEEVDRLRFQAEAEAVAQLHHPNVIHIFDVGVHEDHPFLSFELCEGGSLAQLLEAKTKLPPRSAARILETLARAIHHAHEHHIVHRDLKPANVLLRVPLDPDVDWAKPGVEFPVETLRLVDFGLARRLDVPTNLTETGMVLGTPQYMAPEQIHGPRISLGPSVDVYSLGAILYEVLTGQPPFDADSTFEILRAVVSEEPAPVSQLDSTCPRDLETICSRCLQKSPEARYPSALALAEDLRRFLEDRPIVSRPLGIVERTWRWCRRNPSVASLLSLVFLSLIVGTSVSLFYAKQADTRAKQAKNLATKERKERERADINVVLATKKTQEAESAKKDARDKAVALRENLYVSNMNRAWVAYQNSNLALARRLLRPFAKDESLRKWEWDCLWNLCHQELYTLTQHSASIEALAFNREGTQCASLDESGRLILWEVDTWKPMFVLDGRGDIAFRSDGRYLATLGKGSTMILWDTHTGKQVRIAVTPSKFSTCLAACPKSPRLAVGTSDGSVIVVDTESRNIVWKQKRDKYCIAKLAYSPDGRLLVGAEISPRFQFPQITAEQSKRPALRFYLADRGTPTGGVTRYPETASHLAFEEAGRWLLLGCVNGFTAFLDCKDFEKWGFLGGPRGDVLLSLRQGEARVWSFRGDATQLALVGQDNNIILWNPVSHSAVRERDISKKQTQLVGTHDRAIVRTQFSPDGVQLISGDVGGTLKVWTPSYHLPTHLSGFHFDIALNGDGTRAATSDFRNLIVRGMEDFRSLLSEKAEKAGEFLFVSLDASGNRLAVSIGNSIQPLGKGTVEIWDIAAKKKLHTIGPILGGVKNVQLSPNGRWLAVVTGLSTCELWDLEADLPKNLLQTSRTATCCFAPHKDWFAFADSKTVSILSLDDMENVTTFPHVARPQNLFVSLAINPSGTLAALGRLDGTIELRDLPKGRIRHLLATHGQPIWRLAFLDNGERLVSTSQDLTLRIWDPHLGEQLCSMPVDNQFVGVSHDGSVFACTQDRELRFYDRKPTLANRTMRLAMAHLHRYMWLQPNRQQVLERVSHMKGVPESVTEATRSYVRSFEVEPVRKDAIEQMMDCVCSPDLTPYERDCLLRVAKRLSENSPNDPTAWFLLGAAQCRSQQFMDAIATLQRTERLRPDPNSDVFPLLLAFQILAHSQQPDAAEKDKKAIDGFRTSLRHWLTRHKTSPDSRPARLWLEITKRIPIPQ